MVHARSRRYVIRRDEEKMCGGACAYGLWKIRAKGKGWRDGDAETGVSVRCVNIPALCRRFEGFESWASTLYAEDTKDENVHVINAREIGISSCNLACEVLHKTPREQCLRFYERAMLTALILIGCRPFIASE